MEKRKTFHGRQVGKKRLLPIVFPLFLFLLIPLNGYGDDTPMPEVVQQNSTRITGVVKDAYGEPVIGANVKVVGTTQGTITDFEGKFSINVSGASAKIKISFIGYKDKEVTAKKGVSLNIVLEEDAQTLGEVQVVAYGVQKKVSITGAISSMKGDDLLKTPAGSLSNVLSGQITGISSVQYSGEPGADAADIYVRGVATWNNAKPLIQVDGVERDFSQIDPNEIESVTVLKDASATAVFGVRGANGVILITTKRGAEGKAKVSFSTSAGVNVRTKDLEFANSYQYASYYNMMKVNDGGVATFSDEQLETFRNHSNPLMYPDINWIDYCMNKAAFQSQHNVNISGGTSNMKYFVSAGLFTQGGMFKQFNATDDFNFDYKRYNYRANLDFDVTKTTLLSVNIGGRIETKRTPESGEDQNQLFRKLYWAVPFAGAGIVNGERVVSNSEVLPFTGVDGLSSYYCTANGIRLGKYTDIWGTDNYQASEMIFVRRIGDTSSPEYTNFPVGMENASSGNCPTQTLVDAYESKDNGDKDPRFGMTIACNGDKWPNTNPNPLETFIGGKNGLPLPYATPTGYYLKKYLDASTDISAESGSGGKRHNWVIFRLGEFYLNYAEAIYRYLGAAGATDNEFRMSACAAINKVRQRSDVQMPDFPDNISNTEFWERYKKERMVELAFEQHRFWDVRRWKEGGFTKIGRMQITQKEDGNFLYERTNKSLVWDDKMYFFPIPASEMRKNPNLSQNPGW